MTTSTPSTTPDTALERLDPHVLAPDEAQRLLRDAPWDRFAVVGDSLAQGLGEPTPGYADASWPDRVRTTLHAATGRSLGYVNTGVVGARLQDVIEGQVAAVTDFRPDLVGVIAGGNDLLVDEVDWPGVEGGVRQLFDLLAAVGAHTVFTFMFMQITRAIPALRPTPLHDRLARLNDIVARHAAHRGFLVVDMWRHPASGHAESYSADLLHASRRGHAALASAVVSRLGAHLAGRTAEENP